MAVSSWLDILIGKLGEISTDGKTSLRSYLVYSKSEIPDKIVKENMPCVVTYLEGIGGDWSASASWDYWYGISEFHLFGTADRKLYNKVIDWIPRIRDKVNANAKLGGLVDYFSLVDQEGGIKIKGPVELVYTDEAPHWGIVIRWMVKENVSAQTTLSA